MSDIFVNGKVTRLTLANGHTIDIKDRLNAREFEDLQAKWQPFIRPGMSWEMDVREVRFAKVRAYLLGWSFTQTGEGGPDVPVPFSLDAIDNLSPHAFTQIHKAIEQHEIKREIEVEVLTKNLDGSPESKPLSPSVEP